MQNAKELSPLIGYQSQWLIIGSALILMTILWFVTIFWLTRRRTYRTVSTIGPKEIVGKDLEALRRKYLGLISEIQRLSMQQQLNARQVHQKLSMTVRLFAYEASGFRAQVMTLADIQKGRFPDLGSVIATYYPSEFGVFLRGSVEDAVARAQKVVSAWQ